MERRDRGGHIQGPYPERSATDVGKPAVVHHHRGRRPEGQPKYKKCIDAKFTAGIKAMALPPRTPSLMPLDYAIWKAVERKVAQSAPRGTATKKAFLARLLQCAKSLPKGFVKRVIARTKLNIPAVLDAKGYAPRND